MNYYNYLDAVKDDVRDYINENINIKEFAGKRDELEIQLLDQLWIEDSVTGNSSGSYFCNTYKAEEALAHNWDLLNDALEELGMDDSNILKQGVEAMDVIIRCYLLGAAIFDVLNEFEELEIEEEV